MDKALSELVRISNISGSDTRLVQGGGGNTSAKSADGKYMYIKASGTALKDMNEKRGWRRMKIEPVLAIIKDPAIANMEATTRELEVVNRLLLSCDDNDTSGARPSVEAHLHALFDKYVIHLHPTAVGSYVNCKNGETEIKNLFSGEKIPPLWVPYTDPGFMLGIRMYNLVDKYKSQFGRKPEIIFLAKHGLIVSANTPDAALQLVRKVISLCNSKLKQFEMKKAKAANQEAVANSRLCIRRAFFKATGNYMMVSHFCDDDIAAFMAEKDASKMLSAGALSPDELVYANGPALWLEKCDGEKTAGRLRMQIDNRMKPASAILVKGAGLFVVGEKKVAAIIKEIMATSFLIRNSAYKMGGISSLNKREQDFINHWESEAFRKKLVSGYSEGDLQNRIAVVSGAGSGLGRSIAIGLARAGAAVGLADIDVKAAEETGAIIKNQMRGTSTMVIGCNVTQENSVNEGFDSLLKNWGGLDILVNAAGVAPAFKLVDMPADKWRTAVEINLTGYFLMSKAAAKIMIQQRMGGSIINISSKSGLEASKNNTAYNATKAGEIHMARGWALELGEHGIRVNSISPGNVFEGSKIWNPEYIKVCAKKYGIKPEEVIPYYVSKTALNREIKGQDIADSVVFLCSDKARTITGQTLVVDSGQVMVR